MLSLDNAFNDEDLINFERELKEYLVILKLTMLLNQNLMDYLYLFSIEMVNLNMERQEVMVLR